MTPVATAWTSLSTMSTVQSWRDHSSGRHSPSAVLRTTSPVYTVPKTTATARGPRSPARAATPYAAPPEGPEREMCRVVQASPRRRVLGTDGNHLLGELGGRKTVRAAGDRDLDEPLECGHDGSAPDTCDDASPQHAGTCLVLHHTNPPVGWFATVPPRSHVLSGPGLFRKRRRHAAVPVRLALHRRPR